MRLGVEKMSAGARVVCNGWPGAMACRADWFIKTMPSQGLVVSVGSGGVSEVADRSTRTLLPTGS